jgi:hypothetical protein
MAVRKVSNRGGNIIGYFPSLKMGRMIAFESSIERDLIHVLDFEQEVTWFAEQPVIIVYQHEGKRCTYTPDFHLWRNGQSVLVECKPEGRVQIAENQRKFSAARAWCAAQGCTFEVITDRQLRTGYRLQNIKLLTQFARYDIGPGIQRRIRTCLSTAAAPMTVTDVMVQVATPKPQTALIPILYMAFHHRLWMPLDPAPISVGSLIALSSPSNGGAA